MMTKCPPTFNPRAVAYLFKQEIGDLFNAWNLDRPQRTGAPHASAVLQIESEWCLRRQVLLALYPDEAQAPEPKPWDAHQNAVFLHGEYLHQKYQMLLSKYGTATAIEAKKYDEVRFLWFTPDVEYPFLAQPSIVEIKGYKQEHYDQLDEAGAPPIEAHRQCNLYCHLLGIERGLILVENKNTQDIKTWGIACDAEMAKPYTDRMYQVKGARVKAASGRGYPARACATIQENRAQKCPMRELCFSGRLEGPKP